VSLIAGLAMAGALYQAFAARRGARCLPQCSSVGVGAAGAGATPLDAAGQEGSDPSGPTDGAGAHEQAGPARPRLTVSGSQATSAERSAQVASAVREETPTFSKMWRRWLSTVRGLIPSREAI
jgi:hypothetical protein